MKGTTDDRVKKLGQYHFEESTQRFHIRKVKEKRVRESWGTVTS